MNTSLESLLTSAATLAEALGWALLHSLWQGAIVAAGLFIALGLLRRRSAAVRHAACLFGLLALAVLTARTAWQLRPTSMSGGRETTAAFLAQSSVLAPLSPVAEGDPSVPESRDPADRETSGAARVRPAGGWMHAASSERAWRDRLERWVPWISAVWLFGVIGCSLRHCGGWWRVRALRRCGEDARPEWQQTCTRLAKRFGLRRTVQLLESAEASGPMLTGVLAPVVLLPARLVTGLSAAELEAILAHELAHLARRDAWSNFAQIALETLFFYHPAVWWIGHRARQEREQAADDLALCVCTDRRVYVGALTRLAELQLIPSPALAATGGDLLARIRRIVRPEAVETPASGWSLALLAPLIVALAGSVWIAQVKADEAKAPAPSVAAPAAPAAPDNPRERAEKSYAAAADWVAAAFQLADEPKRIAAIQAIRTALASSDLAEIRKALAAFTQVGQVEFDKAAFRVPLRALLRSSEPDIRASACTALSSCGESADDLALVLALVEDPSPDVRAAVPYALKLLSNHDFTGKAGEGVLQLLSRKDEKAHGWAGQSVGTHQAVWSAMWGTKISPELEARVVEASRTDAQNTGYSEVFYYALTVHLSKREPTVTRLIELASSPDTTNVAGRVLWGIQQGLADDQKPRVAELAVNVLSARSDGYMRRGALACLRQYGSAANVEALRTLLARPGVTGDFRKDLEQTVAKLESRPVGESASPSQPAQVTAPVHTTVKGERSTARASAAEKPEIEVEWQGKWWPATVLKKDGDRTQIHYIGYGSEWDEWVTAERIRPVSTSAATNDAAPGEAARIAQLLDKNRRAARARADQDRQSYSAEQLQEIEKLYQVANSKGKRDPEAVASLKQLLEKYDRANRTGCATLYLGQASLGDERLEYLTRAVEKFSDCYYFNGCQVGGYGRYVLALTLWEKGEKDKARALIAELKTTYKDATDHRGRPITELAEAAEKSFAAQ